jgi:hypothetical protein
MKVFLEDYESINFYSENMLKWLYALFIIYFNLFFQYFFFGKSDEKCRIIFHQIDRLEFSQINVFIGSVGISSSLAKKEQSQNHWIQYKKGNWLKKEMIENNRVDK